MDPRLKVFQYLAKQLKVDHGHVQAWFEEKKRFRVSDEFPKYGKRLKRHCILDETGQCDMIVGDGSETVECEVDPCDVVIEVDEDEEDGGYVGSQE